MIEVLGKEYRDVLVLHVEQITEDSKVVENITRPQVIHVYAYDMHLMSGKINIATLIYYIKRFQIDFLALNIPLAKYVKKGSHLINQLKLTNFSTKIIVTGEAVTTEIAKNIGADSYILHGEDLIRVIESFVDESDNL